MLSGKRASARPLSASHEHYLRAIWEVRSERGYARVTDVARALSIAPPTLSVGIRPLVAQGLVTHDDHHFLILTPAGERVAREVHHRFVVMLTFLRDLLGVPEEAARAEACVLEHGVSDLTTERLLDLVKLMRSDPSLSALFQERFAAFHRDCRPAETCSTCDLACLTGPPPA
jgi:DtxR family transcriptional regulator, Mn-dependent transcriptional regulator